MRYVPSSVPGIMKLFGISGRALVQPHRRGACDFNQCPRNGKKAAPFGTTHVVPSPLLVAALRPHTFPRPYSTRPGLAPVCWPLFRTTVPLTMTYSIPTEC